MSLEVGSINTLDIREVWPKEDADFTPWLQSHISELDQVLGLGLTNAAKEVGAGDFRIDLVAETDFGEVVIENQFGRSDHRHLGQLVTYLSHRDAQRAIWIVEEERREHVKAVETLNERGVGHIWMVTVRAIRIGESAAAPLFTIVAEPSEDVISSTSTGQPLTPVQHWRRNFMSALFEQARDEGIDSPFKEVTPDASGVHSTHARGPRLVYRVAVNRQASRVVVTNRRGFWTGALDVLATKRDEIDKVFASSHLPKPLDWDKHVTKGRWAIRYTVASNYQEKVDREKLLELNRAAEAMKGAFGPHLSKLDRELESDSSEAPS